MRVPFPPPSPPFPSAAKDPPLRDGPPMHTEPPNTGFAPNRGHHHLRRTNCSKYLVRTMSWLVCFHDGLSHKPPKSMLSCDPIFFSPFRDLAVASETITLVATCGHFSGGEGVLQRRQEIVVASGLCSAKSFHRVFPVNAPSGSFLGSSDNFRGRVRCSQHDFHSHQMC